MSEPIEYTCATLFEHILASCTEDLAKSYDLVYVDRDDKLSDEQVEWLLEDDHEALWESLADFEGSQRYESARNEAADLIKGTVERMWRQGEIPEAEDDADDGYFDSDDLWDQFDGSDEYDVLIDRILERDTGSWFKELIDGVGGVLMRIPISDAGTCISTDPGREISGAELLHQWGVPVTGKNLNALDEIFAEVGGPSEADRSPFLLAYLNLGEIYRLGPEVTHIELEQPHLLLTNIYAGDGYEAQLDTWVRVSVKNLRTDKGAPGSSWDSIAGVYKPAYTCEIRIVPPTEEKAA